MSKQVVMPRLSDTMETGTIARWVKHEGESVQKGEVIAEIETDKANMELESYDSGILANVTVGEGQSAAVGAPIATIASNEEEADAIRGNESGADPNQTASREETEEAPTRQQASEQMPSQNDRRDGHDSAGQPQTSPGNERIKASPLARRMAQEQSIDLANVRGNGPGGRITKDDIEAYLRQPEEERGPRAPTVRTPEVQREQAVTSVTALRGQHPVEMSRMQRTIARRMAEARFSAPDFVLTAEFDVTEVQQMLRGLREIEDAPRIGPNDVVIKAVATALRQHPEVNSGWENDQIQRYDRVNVGNAVAVEGGLVVPVILDADAKTLSEISQESKSLIEKARSGKLAPSEYEGGTFSVSNLGMYGIDQFTPIINVPESCILGVGAITPKPVVVDAQVVIRDRMRVDLACDHRVVNGAQGAEFLLTLRRLVERPLLAVL